VTRNVAFWAVEATTANIRLSLLMINNVALAGVLGGVLTPIYGHLQKESSFNPAIMGMMPKPKARPAGGQNGQYEPCECQA
jgi:hypothetical protein